MLHQCAPPGRTGHLTGGKFGANREDPTQLDRFPHRLRQAHIVDLAILDRNLPFSDLSRLLRAMPRDVSGISFAFFDGRVDHVRRGSRRSASELFRHEFRCRNPFLNLDSHFLSLLILSLVLPQDSVWYL